MVGVLCPDCKRFRRVAYRLFTGRWVWLGHADRFSHARFRFYFVKHDPKEPPHVHMERGGAAAKFWLERC
jgi:hypothetical protein